MRLSRFGEKFAGRSGVVDLMSDLGEALRADPELVFMGGGNPARVPAAEETFRKTLEALLAEPGEWQRLVGAYQSPQGNPSFREALARYLRDRYGWEVGAEHIAVSNGSQSAYFILYNLFAGAMPDGSQRRIHLPLVPEYIGYADAGLSADFFSATAPAIELLPDRQFRYHVAFDQLVIDDGVGALCVSRPTNPTGNVLGAAELERLGTLARSADIPLIVDGAYGDPFPAITFTEAAPAWDEQTILTLSLSKLGLPGARTGIVIAAEPIVRAFASASTIISLAAGNLGPVLATRMLEDGTMDRVSGELLRPFYRARCEETLAGLHRELEGLPWRVHRPDGAFFLWLWFDDLPVPSQELYRRLKARGLLAIPGERFFISLDPAWAHARQCLRLSYAQDPAVVARGLRLLGEELRALYGAGLN
ncbi:valine--pyruvate transaminase [Pseudohaliea rubra]|uniref:Valine--pyruvate aminotransferase n=1 Tax=Pseudohaliea rubra DSM 19751 TaxID=1265313 RepID=A0A095VQ41_9GAMM|nr:valine--pyruvate transaminase [Pseudohaliea rubra]KGE03567.1 Valine--pyruvate aminotransferase [Pseudohaliea rubra DSM 19751]